MRIQKTSIHFIVTGSVHAMADLVDRRSAHLFMPEIKVENT